MAKSAWQRPETPGMSPWLQALGQDLRFGARLLVKDRRVTFAAVAVLALALGAATTAFTFVNGSVLRDLPLADSDRLVWIRTVDARGRQLGVSFADVRDWGATARTLSHVVVSYEFPINIAEETLSPQRYSGSFISVNAFAMVGRAPVLGRAFRPEDDLPGAPRVAIIAHTLWQSRYGGSPTVLGRTVRTNDVPTTIVGVMPEGFHFPFTSEVWVPLVHTAGPPEKVDAARGTRRMLAVAFGRLDDGAGREQAQAEMNAVTSRLARDNPATNEGISVAVLPIADLYGGGEMGLRQMLLVVLGAVFVVLCIACVNVATLLLARAVHRSREIAIRVSLGASRARIIRQLFVESILLAAVAGGLGFLLSLYGVSIFGRALAYGWTIDGPPPFWLNFSIDARVYLFFAAVCVGASILFGLMPALTVSRTNAEVLKEGGQRASAGLHTRRWAGALMSVQLALTFALLAGTGLMLRSFLVIYQAGNVLDTSNLVTMQLSFGGTRYAQPSQIKELFRQLDERLASVQALSAVTVASDIPMMTVINSQRQLAIEGRPTTDGKPPTVAYLYIGPRYFETLRLRLLRGREFTGDDGSPGREAAIVNQQFASMFFPDADPIGQRIQLVNATAPNTPQPWVTIVGVAPTVPQIAFSQTPEPVVYAALRGEPAPHRFASIIARAEGDRATLLSLLRETVRKVDPDLPGYYFRTMDEVMAMSRWRQRLCAIMFALLAGIATVLSAVGLYAVVAHGVAQRTREIGVRVALGARSRQVLWLFVRRGCVQLAIGLLVGLAGAVALGRQLEPLLVRTASTDVLALGAVSALLVTVAMAAIVWPARRAMRVDPATALRSQ